MKPSTAELLRIYRRTLAKYEAENDPKLETHRRLTQSLERKQEAA